MAKVTMPLLSGDASGQVAKAMVFSKWKGRNYVRKYVIPSYSNTTHQANIRSIITDASRAWSLGSTVGAVTINNAYKTAYNTAATTYQISGFNLFIKDCVAKNDGVSYSGTLALPTEPGDVA